MFGEARGIPRQGDTDTKIRRVNPKRLRPLKRMSPYQAADTAELREIASQETLH